MKYENVAYSGVQLSEFQPEDMLPLLLGAAGVGGILFILLRYVWPSLFLDWIYIRSRKRIWDAVIKAMEEKTFFIDIFEDIVSKHPSKAFLIYEDKMYSYEEIDKLVNKAAKTALEIGLKPGDVVAVLLYNEPAIVWTYLAMFLV